MEHHNSRLQSLIDKYLKGTCNKEESEIVENFFESFSSRPDILDQLDFEKQNEIKKRIQENVVKKISPTPIRKISLIKLAVAATVALFCISIAYQYQYKNRSLKNIEINLASGQQRHITLEDGTKITLNASSRIIYPNSFKDSSKREVILIGEAFFDVAKNPKKPFIIHTPRMEISVLGTAFNVRDYENEVNAETALIRGKVSIWKTGHTNNKFILNPNEKFVLSNANIHNNAQSTNPKVVSLQNATVAVQPLVVSNQDGTALETEWMLKRMTIRDERLADIVIKLERMYGVEIQILSSKIATQRFSATFENEDLDNILKALQTVNYFQIKKTGKTQIQLF
ncbi:MULTISPECIES: FecR family protein [Sphingobacterium]|uniref:FecR family protein n=1 Tax=Sphingobacterium TaxID=28453 RepID=UPI00104F4C88|nr:MULTISPECIES: FecR domain-containing protein [Sphingobacterium]MCW2259715.1 ferric-dicitrate binding protein FerR (iron transport regulator) [Sphingobacterium kitahiroshimense]TCR03443.1 FecR family protein [Sphingobacterium sp. JUb78]